MTQKLNIIPVKELKKQGLTYLIYGVPGVGKTTTIKFLGGKTLLISVDKTAQVLSECDNIDVLDYDVTQAWTNWANTVIALDGLPYDNIVIDNISELEKCFLAEMGRNGKNNGIPTMMDYQKLQFMILSSIRKLKSYNKNLILTAWETYEDVTDADTGQLYTMIVPDIQRKIRANVSGLCDIVARLVATHEKDGQIKRGFYLAPTRSIFAKNQLDDRKGCSQNELFTPPVSTGTNK